MSFSQNVNLYNAGRDGSCGANGANGRDGIGYGGSGYDGSPGKRGEDGRNAGPPTASYFDVQESYGEIGCTVIFEKAPAPADRHQTETKKYKFVLGEPRSSIAADTHGGDGGHGGKGGSGGNGAMGYPGQNATSSSAGTAGGRGGDGGDGGRGGDGGDAGAGGDIEYTVSQEDMDLLMLFQQVSPNTSAGVLGDGGPGGCGGYGGCGGPGGASYSWTETRTGYSNGQSYTYTVSHSNPGGPPGPPGISGRDGSRGKDGRGAKDGKFTIVAGPNRYRSLYDLHVCNVSHIDVDGYNIMEPGCDALLSLSHLNRGGMPTPSHQRIYAYLKSTEWVRFQFVNCVGLANQINAGDTLALPQPIRYAVTDTNEIAFGDPFGKTGILDHQACVERVRQVFNHVASQEDTIQVRFPANLMLMKGADVLCPGDDGPVVSTLVNISRLAIGMQAQPFQRVLRMIVRAQVGGSSKLDQEIVNRENEGGSVVTANDVVLRRADGAPTDVAAGVSVPVDVVHGNGKTRQAPLTLEFVGPTLQPYSRLTIHSTMMLGHVQNKMKERAVHVRPFTVQLGERYKYGKENKFLIVCNNRSTNAEMTSWRSHIARLGGEVAVWNVNYYKDFAITHRRVDGRSLFEDFTWGTIVFLNNPFLEDEKLDKYTAPTYIRPRELLIAARNAGTTTLMVGPFKQFDMEEQLLPAVPSEQRVLSVFQSTKKFIQSATSARLTTGAGVAQPLPALDIADLSGLVWKRGGQTGKKGWKLRFYTVHREARTLCYYKNPKQQFPNGTVYLGRFVLVLPSRLPSEVNPAFTDAESRSMEEMDAGYTFRIATSTREFIMRVPNPTEYQKKKFTVANVRQDWTASAPPLLEVLQSLAESVTYEDNEEAGSASNVEESANDSPTAPPESELGAGALGDWEGWMEKRGNRRNKAFKRRYFVLHASKAVLHYYKKTKDAETSAKSQGFIDLGRYRIVIGDYDGIDRGSEEKKFQIVTPDRVFHLRTESEEQRSEYIDAIQQCVAPVEDVESATTEQARVLIEKQVSELAIKQADSPFTEQGEETQADRMRRTHTETYSSSLESFRVARIPVEKFALIGKPGAKALGKAAKKLAKTIVKKLPNQRVVVVYRPADVTKRGMRHHIGDLEVHRSLDRSSVHIVQLNIGDASLQHSSQINESAPAIYSLARSMPFERKLAAFNHALDSEYGSEKLSESMFADRPMSMASLMSFALLADVGDEQHAFRSSKWNAGLNADILQARLRRLIALRDFPSAQSSFEITIDDSNALTNPNLFKDTQDDGIDNEGGDGDDTYDEDDDDPDNIGKQKPVEAVPQDVRVALKERLLGKLDFTVPDGVYIPFAADLLIEIVGHLRYMMQTATSWVDKIMFSRRKSAVKKASLRLIDELIHQRLLANVDARFRSAAYKYVIKRASMKLRKWQIELADKEKDGFKLTRSNVRKPKKKTILTVYRQPDDLTFGFADTNYELPLTMSSAEFDGHAHPWRKAAVAENRFMYSSPAQREERIREYERDGGCPAGDELRRRCGVENMPPVNSSVAI